MGLLSLGTPLSWLESRKYNEHVKRNGIEQLLKVFAAASSRDGDPLAWGDELEYMMVEYDSQDGSGNAMLDVKRDEILTSLNTEYLPLCTAHNVHFHPEYGRYMLEATPHRPYYGYSGEYVEFNMCQRRQVALEKYREMDISKELGILTLAVFPRMGCDEFVNLPAELRDQKNNASRSLFLPDEVINRHIRFPTLTTNIKTRRGEKVCINVPVYVDSKTPMVDDTVYERDWFVPEDKESLLASEPRHIYMDAMGFGMGCCCLQATFQAPNLEMARYLYDSLANLATVMLAASAASPMFKGWLADQDVRWNVISGAVDDRTPFERSKDPLLPKYNPQGLGGIDPSEYDHVQRLPKSRYSTQDLYLGGNKFFSQSYNDTEVPLNRNVLDRLMENDIAPMDYDLAKHFAHLYVRDPLVIFEESLEQDNDHSTNHFENIQSTNWQTLRFKPPTQEAVPDNKEAPGWRVEFRTLEVQLTDFENAAYTALCYLIVESLLTFHNHINAYIPMSDVWSNMTRAHARDALVEGKFAWKDSFEPNETGSSLKSMDEIFHSPKFGIFPVFVDPLLRHKSFVLKNWQELKFSNEHKRLYYYLKLLSDRASGNLPSTARFLRQYVLAHSDYKKDSKVSKQINYDVLKMCDRITRLDDSKQELSQFFGPEIAEYLKNTRPSSTLK
ncbi:hypothetical protein ZYGR_0R00820 [Zygosaccharomyces rouxii]|uniref:Glutamate--cysteine ligase n=2 Tax=Zygosaccharomyces rouxii TaxID=4956 RepID=C5DX36_ZYGRC|nr:uncharacterized protein ZYRO0F01936g [Zygosaccharomyces rouxii]KAH9199112.1 glutamate-cysteine ligase-domain-containing protein [Zygosaccharomyces rouxii]GAV49840.1 hypothetical protein ZYGR_0R00820 [Zygosaccharomyces rouxii]CAR28347.1 ZYRO0F01936p [Zygosaccharomyces rouxii]